MSEGLQADFAMPFVEARWIDVVPRAAARPQLSARVFLHAGPPFRAAPPAPVVHAAMHAAMLEGLAGDVAEARQLIDSGAIELLPAQDYGIATPLAQVVSASMLLLAVEQRGLTCYAPIVEGAPPALRFGSAAPECRQRMGEVGAWVQDRVAPLIRATPVAIDALIRIAVAGGDECHARTSVANEALAHGIQGLDRVDMLRLKAMPAFVLPLMMAAACAAMRSRGDTEAIGGNGVEFGVRRRHSGWICAPAEAPRGSRFDAAQILTVLPAIGDSAVIDFCGLGGQALSAAPLLAAEWHGELPPDALNRRGILIDPDTGIVEAARVERTGIGPLINLAMLDRDGQAGLIGRGFYAPHPRLFSGRSV